MREVICPTCEGEGCPYCGGPERDYHEGCCACETCGGLGVVHLGWRDEAAAGFVQGATMGAFAGIFGAIWF